MIEYDLNNISALLAKTKFEAEKFLANIDQYPVAHEVPFIPHTQLTSTGMGGLKALELLKEKYIPWFSASAGPRYFAFVTGGSTPASIMGDWLTSTYDQNGSDAGESGTRQLTLDTCQMLRSLLHLPEEFSATFVSGATTSSLVGLATARQWLGHKRNINVSLDGVHALGAVIVLSATAHSSISKVLSILGLGRNALETIPTLPNREAIDIDALEARLQSIAHDNAGPAIVIANAGTVNTCDFDDIKAIGALKQKYDFWLHVDAAFGGLAAASERYAHLLDGIELADSITIDAHKWMNVPYDAALIFCRHLHLQGETFNSMAAYLPAIVQPDTFIHLTPENSQRVRALPLWMSLVAYGRQGYSRIIEQCCDIARFASDCINTHPRFELLAPVRLNGVCFTLLDEAGKRYDAELIKAFLNVLQKGGSTFLTPTQFKGIPAIRISVCNWRTTFEDMELAWEAITHTLIQLDGKY